MACLSTCKEFGLTEMYSAVEDELVENRSALPAVFQDLEELELIGTPLTHARFNRRHSGTYGPLMPSEAGMLPGPSTPVEGLLCCGDSTFPGIGVPAAAASGCAAANALMS
ncbi:unnamed protein product, partial [Polarella glacialis]